MTDSARFTHPRYTLGKDGRIKRKCSAVHLTSEERNFEEASVIESITDYVQGQMRRLGLLEYWLPDADEEARCNIFASDLHHASKLLVILHNQVGSKPGIWSRSLCLSHGLKVGSMIDAIQRALEFGYAVCVLNPNTNSVAIPGSARRIPIANSFSPESHVLNVWDTIIAPANIPSIVMLTYGNGCSLAVDVLQRQLVRCATTPGEQLRIHAIAAIEPSQVIECGGDTDAATKAALKALALAYEGNVVHPYPKRLFTREEKLGCTCLSVGTAMSDTFQSDKNVAASVGLALESVMRFFVFSESPPEDATELGVAFAKAEAKRVGFHSATLQEGSSFNKRNATPQPVFMSASIPRASPFFLRWLATSRHAKCAGVEQHIVSNSLTVADFDLLRVVGKGAFGKVMLVRKRKHQDEGGIFAMKVLKKSVIAAKGQTEHTRSERSILCEIRHPFIVRLRYAFQSDEKLYLVTDYYNGGSLFYHLRKSHGFNEDRSRFYAAELVLALDHLHSNGVIYRDLKLENILMDHLGHIALTDFGLSKENVTDVFNSQLTTFCGTAEYIAPELLKGQKYGASVDWWSFGILLYEMMGFRTPFYEKNRKLMFHGATAGRQLHTFLK
mmetsp:Transcript_5547/g.17493  ORF Transcript_5547/g.17493 Transcript_5547/m.17493 type:complete len:614 (-) Transcript_5547:923-2764(-)